MALDKEMLWMVEVFQAYRKKHRLPNASPLELVSAPYRDNLQVRHIDWLQQFLVVCEAVEYNCNTKSGDT